MYAREQLTIYKYFAEVLDGHRITDVLDPLTGLVARNHIIAFVKSLIELKVPFTFGMIDLDNFKYINDSYGHAVGDKVLVSFAEEIQKYFEGYGVTGRFGGDEFLFVNLRDIEYDDKKKFCTQMYDPRYLLRKTHHIENREIFVTGTVGLASFPLDTQDYNELFTMIDKTLYRGKSKGRNCYIIYVPEKHKDIEIIKLKKNSLYETFRNLAAGFDSTDDFHGKMRAVYESLKNDLHITNMYYVGKSMQLISMVDGHAFGAVTDIGKLMTEEIFATNDLAHIESTSPELYNVLTENEIESLLIMTISMGAKDYGYLMCAEPHTLRIWQEDEYAILFMFARMLAVYMQGHQIELN